MPYEVEIFIGAVRVGMMEKEMIVNPSRHKVQILTALLESINVCAVRCARS